MNYSHNPRQTIVHIVVYNRFCELDIVIVPTI